MPRISIPEDSKPWRCSINGVDYVYEAGTVQEVPDEVFDLICAQMDAEQLHAPEEFVDPPFGWLPMERPNSEGTFGVKQTADYENMRLVCEWVPVVEEVSGM